MEEEIDLRRYINVLLKHWVLIVSITLVAGIVAGLVSFLTVTPTYEAKAAVLIKVDRAKIDFENKNQMFLATEDESYKQALVSLVKSSAVASAAIEQLGDKLEPHERSVTGVMGNVSVKEDGDLIEISFKSADAEKAAAIANAWAKSYESYTNSLFSGILLSQEESLVDQADAAREDYEVKQGALEDFLGNNSIAELNDRIADFDLLINIKSLQQQLEFGALSQASSMANSLSLILLQTKAFTLLSPEIQVSLDGLLAVDYDREKQLRDIGALISTLELRSGITPGLSIGELRQEILLLQMNLERESAKKQELEKSRDTAWQAYTTLENRVIEAKVASQARDVVVRVAVPAAVPEVPVQSQRVIKIAIALVLGLIVGVFAAFGAEYFKGTGPRPGAKEVQADAQIKEAEKGDAPQDRGD